ncbi:hypothetical protein NsoK4_03650 [Nitrosopumilus sp. K4]|uniref:hypothetical protein n=1 Tax=Nitrosopumilus sp. K4 TaxID=2795383 RepID=UPI001BA828DD|nr:hypothetical protein [Nitrosopumilus sp. K4]QUC65350.1 hypothetical protein NsoK4_03650 [Nitrosopumilus sp. K4]
MAKIEKLYQNVAMQVIRRCHGSIQLKKRGNVIEVYDVKRHFWSKGLAGLIIKEECKLANLKDWEIARVRAFIIDELKSNK